ncbi:hypothetical protein HK100_011040 [Physocladia obscura]|uniref:Homeobox domain-containing protein n=1 Tax=Physocladia obscura TaxID=109957 RepID=A0AAD5T4H2_9FUNG|nr:hypothetical protein HK100_011040 [Physocladia obscura]
MDRNKEVVGGGGGSSGLEVLVRASEAAVRSRSASESGSRSLGGSGGSGGGPVMETTRVDTAVNANSGNLSVSGAIAGTASALMALSSSLAQSHTQLHAQSQTQSPRLPSLPLPLPLPSIARLFSDSTSATTNLNANMNTNANATTMNVDNRSYPPPADSNGRHSSRSVSSANLPFANPDPLPPPLSYPYLIPPPPPPNQNLHFDRPSVESSVGPRPSTTNASSFVSASIGASGAIENQADPAQIDHVMTHNSYPSEELGSRNSSHTRSGSFSSSNVNQQPSMLSPNQQYSHQTILPPLRLMPHSVAHTPLLPSFHSPQFQDQSQNFHPFISDMPANNIQQQQQQFSEDQNYSQHHSDMLRRNSYSQGSFISSHQQVQQTQMQSSPYQQNFQSTFFHHQQPQSQYYQPQQHRQQYQHQHSHYSQIVPPTSQIYLQQFDQNSSNPLPLVVSSMPVIQHPQTPQSGLSPALPPSRGAGHQHRVAAATRSSGSSTNNSPTQQYHHHAHPHSPYHHHNHYPPPSVHNEQKIQQLQQQHAPPHRKRETARRYRLSRPQITCLSKLFEVDPSPSAALHLKIAEVTGMPRKAVRLWFQNARAKLRREARTEGFRDPNTASELKKYQYFLASRLPDDPLPPRRRRSLDATATSTATSTAAASGSTGGGVVNSEWEGFRSYDDDGHAVVPLKNMMTITKEIHDILAAYENGEFGVVIPNSYAGSSGGLVGAVAGGVGSGSGNSSGIGQGGSGGREGKLEASGSGIGLSGGNWNGQKGGGDDEEEDDASNYEDDEDN